MEKIAPYPPTVIWRHRRENLKKCSLQPLKHREDLIFLTYPSDPIPELPGYILLDLEAPPLTYNDRARGLFILDATWRYAEVMERQLPASEEWTRRSIPKEFVTSYPRKQQDCPDPTRGLASVEALYICYHILGRPTMGLLDSYYPRDEFLAQNHALLKETSPFT